jgi:hypothetical protein
MSPQFSVHNMPQYKCTKKYSQTEYHTATSSSSAAGFSPGFCETGLLFLRPAFVSKNFASGGACGGHHNVVY